MRRGRLGVIGVLGVLGVGLIADRTVAQTRVAHTPSASVSRADVPLPHLEPTPVEPASAANAAPAANGTALPRERFRPAYDPRLHVRPPLMRTLSGEPAPLVEDVDFLERAARFAAGPGSTRRAPDRGEALRVGEVLVLQGDDQTTKTDPRGGFTLSLTAVAKRTIEELGDQFHFITVWMTFSDAATPTAGAYEITIKNDVRGINVVTTDNSAKYGSEGVLRSMLNMKRQAERAGDTRETWGDRIEVWGQESAHRWLVFMRFLDRRTGRASDQMLGRQCAHYARFTESQGSIQDGIWWKDNGDGSFTVQDSTERYGNLDLYGMGLLAPDEVPPWFLIDEVPGYKHPGCGTPYDMAAAMRPAGRTISGKRVDISIDDVIAVHGERRPSADESQSYWREANVVLTLPTETPTTPRVMQIAERVDRARVWWEDWNRSASLNRHVICTQVSKDCGDPRSDVVEVKLQPNAGEVFLPTGTPASAEIEVRNRGDRDATGVRLVVEAREGARVAGDGRMLGTLAAGQATTARLPLPLPYFACGAEVGLKVYTQSDFHYHRWRQTILVGAEAAVREGFETETGWRVNPNGDDTAEAGMGGWERGTPTRTAHANSATPLQPSGAREGTGAFVTGATRGFVRGGKTTLESPAWESRAWRAPILRYWVSFTSTRQPNPAAPLIEPNPEGSLIVSARAGSGPWLEIDRLTGGPDTVLARWQRRMVKLPSALKLDSTVQLRLVAEDRGEASGLTGTAVEAAIDGLLISSNVAACGSIAAPPDPPPLPTFDGGLLPASADAAPAPSDARRADASASLAAEDGDGGARDAGGTVTIAPETACDCRLGRRTGSNGAPGTSIVAALGLGACLARRWRGRRSRGVRD